MEGLSLKQLRDMIADELGDDDAQATANFDKYLNLAASEAWYYAAWPQRRDRDFYEMKTAYSTGTVTLTNGSTAVTGSSTVWTTAAHGGPSKLALAYGKTPYTVRTVSSNTAIVLEEPYAGTTVSGSTYIIYRDLILLDPRVETITRVRLHDTDRTYDLPVTFGNKTSGAGYYPFSAGRPEWAALDKVINGQKTLRLGPYAPDAAYRIEYEYLTKYQQMGEDGDTHGLGHRLDDAILRGALAHAYRRDHFARSRVMEQDFRLALAREWGALGEVSPMIFQLGKRGGSMRDGPEDWPVNLSSAEI